MGMGLGLPGLGLTGMPLAPLQGGVGVASSANLASAADAVLQGEDAQNIFKLQ